MKLLKCHFLAYNHLSKTIEITRVNLFNIATQYKALFDDDYGSDVNSKVNLMFSSWLHEKLDEFLRQLENDLSQCNNSLMDINSILGQCMYFGVSFSRIGNFPSIHTSNNIIDINSIQALISAPRCHQYS